MKYLVELLKIGMEFHFFGFVVFAALAIGIKFESYIGFCVVALYFLIKGVFRIFTNYFEIKLRHPSGGQKSAQK